MTTRATLQHLAKVIQTDSNAFLILKTEKPEILVYILDKGHLWLSPSQSPLSFQFLEAQNFDFSKCKSDSILINNSLFICEDDVQLNIAKKINLRFALDIFDDQSRPLIVWGAQLLQWSNSQKFCSSCGSLLVYHTNEISKVCSNCSKSFYPSPHPVSIVLITRLLNGQKQFLLAKGLAPKKHFSCIAGFVEAGESFETCAHRESIEEVGIKIKDLKYYGSQVWPFPGQIMAGFIAEWESGEIRIDPQEISEAQWFNWNELPMLPPKSSIARQMIDHEMLSLNNKII